MKIFCFIILIFLILDQASGQETRKVYLDKNDQASNRYLAIYPGTLPLKGLMFLIPGFGETPEDVLVQTDLPKLAAGQGILTIIPTFKSGVTTLGIDDIT